MRRTARSAPWALAFAVLAFSAVAAAEPTPQQIKAASEEFDKGVKSAQASDFEGAAVHFENADHEAPSDATLKAAIRARRDAKQSDRAATLAELALVRHADKEEITTFARSVILGVEKSLGKVEVACKPACELAIDKKIVHGEAAQKRVLWLSPGKHIVAAGWGAKGASKELSVEVGSSAQLSFAPPEEAKPAVVEKPTKPATEPTTDDKPPPPPKSSGKGGPGLFIGGAVVTGVLAGVSIWSGLDTKSNPGPDKVKEACVGKGDTCPEYRDGLAKQSRTNLLFGLTAGAAVVTGVIGVAFTDWGSGEKASRTRIVPVAAVGDKGATVGAVGRF